MDGSWAPGSGDGRGKGPGTERGGTGRGAEETQRAGSQPCAPRGLGLTARRTESREGPRAGRATSAARLTRSAWWPETTVVGGPRGLGSWPRAGGGGRLTPGTCRRERGPRRMCVSRDADSPAPARSANLEPSPPAPRRSRTRHGPFPEARSDPSFWKHPQSCCGKPGKLLLRNGGEEEPLASGDQEPPNEWRRSGGGEPHRTRLASTRSGWAGRCRRCSGSGTWTPSEETPGPKRWFYLQVAKNGLLLCTRRKLTTTARLRQGPCAAPGPARPPLWGLRLTGLWDSAAAGPRPLV